MPIASVSRIFLRLVGVALFSSLAPALWALGGVTDGFDPNVNGNVFAIAVQPDGKVLVAGSFTTVQPNGTPTAITRNSLARFNPDGTLDFSFGDPGVNGQISALVLAPDGSMVIGGKFTAVAGQTRNRVARLNSAGVLDPTFDPNIEPVPAVSLTPEVTSLALQTDGKLIVGGGFVRVQPNGGPLATRNRIARFNADGSLDTTFSPSANNMVLALALQPDGKILVGGGFTMLQGVGDPVPTAPNYVRIARLNTDGTIDKKFNPQADNAVSAIAIQPDGRILIGGSFANVTAANQTTAESRTGLARLNTDGTLDETMLVTIEGNVSALALQPDGRILVGGAVSISGIIYAARLLPDGTVDGGFTAGPNFDVYAFGLQSDGSIVLGGGFNTLRGTGVSTVVRNHVARVNPDGALDNDFRPDVNGRLLTLALQSDGKIVVGGSFTSVAGATHSGLVRLNANGIVDSTFNVNVTGTVSAILVQPSDQKILIGGSFTQVNGALHRNLARLNTDGSLDTSFTAGVNAQVNAMVQQTDGKIILAGGFNLVQPTGSTQSTVRDYIARLNSDGSLDGNYDPNANAAIFALALQPSDGKLLIGGGFNALLPVGQAAAIPRLGIARLNADGNVDTGFDPNVNGPVLTIVVQSDNKIVFGGSFQQLAPNEGLATNRSNIARVNANGTVDSTFDPSTNSVVNRIGLAANGQLLLGGVFSALTPNGGATVTRNYIARVNADGTLDTAFDAGLDVLPGHQVLTFGFPAGGQVLFGGAFTTLTHGNSGPVARNRLAQINADGSIDTTFDSDLSTAAGATINALTLQSSGTILAVGAFAGFNGTDGSNFAQFFPDGSPSLSFSPAIDGSVLAVAQLPTKGAPITTQAPGFAWLGADGNLRPGFAFASGVTIGSLTAMVVQPDNKILIAGDVSVNGATAPVLRLNPDGTLDPSFTVLAGASVTTIALQSDGKILIGGDFTTLGGTDKDRIARLNANGTLDTSFVANADNTVSSIVEKANGQIVIGGLFASISPVPGTTIGTLRSHIARLNTDGSLDTAYNPTANGSVDAMILLPSGKILAGGGFTTFQPNGAATATTRDYLARLNDDGTLDTVDYTPDSPVSTIVAQPDGKIIVAGLFTNIGGVARNYLARLNTDDTVDSTFNPNPNGAVNSVSIQADGKFLVSGQFTALEPNASGAVYNVSAATPRSYVARLNADGTIDASFNPNFNNPAIVVIAYPNGVPGVPDNTVIAAGSFTSIQPTGSVLIGGSFGYINGVAVQNLALFSSDGSISSTFQPNPNGAVYAFVPLIDDRLVIAGAFTTVSGATRNRVARFNTDGTLDANFNPNANGDVFAAAVQSDGSLIVGGSFTNIAGAGRSNLARLKTDGSIDASFAPSIAGAVHTIVVQRDGRVLVVSDGSGVRTVLSRLNADGSADATFAPVATVSDPINTVALQTDGKIVVGGGFTTIRGAAQPYIARLNADGSLDPTLNAVPNGAVTSIIIQTDGKILFGGTFSTVDGLPRFGLARLAATTTAVQSFGLSGDHGTVVWRRSGSGPEIYAALFESSTDATNWTLLGYASRIPNTSNWWLSGVSLPAGDTVFVRARGIIPVSPGGSSGLVEAQTEFVTSAPIITSATVVGGTSGTAFTYAITATGEPTNYSAANLPAGLGIDSTTGLITGTPTQSGTFNVVITAENSSGFASTTLTLVVAASGGPTTNVGRLINLSVSAEVTADNPIIAGFVISGTSPQSILLRAVGPSLATMNIADPLALPHLELYDGRNQRLLEADDWSNSNSLITVFNQLGATPLQANSADAAVVATLAPGPYSIHVTSRDKTAGFALGEIYDASANPPPAGSPHLVNLSARGVVAGGHLVSGGFVITGTTPVRVLVRGIGPGLTAQNVPAVLADPFVTLFHHVSSTSAVIIANNDNWETPLTVDNNYPGASGNDLAAAAATTGAFALASGSTDAAVLVTLAPGIYSAQVSGVGAATGAAMVEIYEVP